MVFCIKYPTWCICTHFSYLISQAFVRKTCQHNVFFDQGFVHKTHQQQHHGLILASDVHH
jgi:hypothetical protein